MCSDHFEWHVCCIMHNNNVLIWTNYKNCDTFCTGQLTLPDQAKCYGIEVNCVLIDNIKSFQAVDFVCRVHTGCLKKIVRRLIKY